jgi:uroporphyrinogen decarboxylase
MTSHERFTRMFEHRDADRVPIIDGPWSSTIERWHREGMPENADYVDYFGLDQHHDLTFEGSHGVTIDTSPRYPQEVIEETDEYVTATSSWGVTSRNWRHANSTPEFVDFTIVDPDSWREAKERMVPSEDRIDWDFFRTNYANWRRDGAWLQAQFWFGFDITHSWTVGTERVLIAIAEEPEWLVDMFNTELDMSIALWQKVWDAGYQFDSVFWADDMGYKHNQFFSAATYRRLLKPVHKRAIDWAHSHGIKAHLHSCGDINPLIPDLLDIGLDALNPLEVKAGMDPVHIKNTYGDKLVLHGGLNAVLFEDMDKMEAQMRATIPAMKEHGGYILSSDHSVPSSVSLQDFKRFVEIGKELGSYE